MPSLGEKRKPLSPIICERCTIVVERTSPKQKRCAPCSREVLNEVRRGDRTYYLKNHSAIRAQAVKSRLRTRYGLSWEQYEQMFVSQSGACAICNSPCKTGDRLAVDHDHQTGRVRGLLCKSCNMRLAHLEDTDWRDRAERYLREQV